MFVKELGLLYIVNVQQIDSILFSLAAPNASLKMSFQVISGDPTSTVLAHADHKHRTNLSTTKKIIGSEFLALFFAWMFIYIYSRVIPHGCIRLHVGGCTHVGSPHCF